MAFSNRPTANSRWASMGSPGSRVRSFRACQGLSLRGVQRTLALTHPPVSPSAMLNGVGTPVAIILQLNTLPPVNASMAALRLSTHDAGPGWLATLRYSSNVSQALSLIADSQTQVSKTRARGEL